MNSTQKRLLILTLLCISALAMCIFGVYQIYHTPKIILNGNETITINLYEKYKEMGAVAYNHASNLTNDIEISNNIDENKPGEYKVTYKIRNTKIERNVIVKDNISPTITLVGNKKIILKLNTEYKELGANAKDNIDGDISKKIEIINNIDNSKIGDYTVTYKVTDKSGNTTTQERKVLVREDDTYIRVSIEKQIIEVYKDNEMVISSPIVTGTNKYSDTDRGIFKIYYKSKNVYLKGPGYLSYVNYWMPYNGGEGLHDATWRNEFGNEIYKTNGSHGCVNMPLDIAKKIYDIVKIGTIVEVY